MKTKKKPVRKGDIMQIAKQIGDIATGQAEDTISKHYKNESLPVKKLIIKKKK